MQILVSMIVTVHGALTGSVVVVVDNVVVVLVVCMLEIVV